MPTYRGSCHCGKVAYQVDTELTELTTCDCSLCRKKNALMFKVHEDRLKILSGEEALGTYQWNSNVAKHFFCATCGIYTFHKKRAQPDHYGVNFQTLDNFDGPMPPVRATDGLDMTVVSDRPRAEWPGPRGAPGGPIR